MESRAGADDTPDDASGDGDTAQAAAGTSGRRVVLFIYVASIATAAIFGAVLGFMLDVQNGPGTAVFGPLTFPITPLTLAVFGAVMVGLVLTIGLLLVYVASAFEG